MGRKKKTDPAVIPEENSIPVLTDLLEIVDSNQKQIRKKPAQSSWFVFILYPQDNDRNENADIMQYIINEHLLFPEWAYIMHDQDVLDTTTDDHVAGEHKKDHVHLLFKTHRRYTLNGIHIHFNGILNSKQVEIVNDEISYLKYMLHQTWNSKEDGKYPYTADQITATGKLKNILSIQNENFVQKLLIHIIQKETTLDNVIDAIYEIDDIELQNSLENLLVNKAFFAKYSDQKIHIKHYQESKERKECQK